MANSYEHELKLAELAVQKAVIVTRKVLQLVEKGELAKDNKTPVSLADFAAQALLVAAIHHRFPDDTIVGEEDTRLLATSPALVERVWQLVASSRLDDAASEALLHAPASAADMLRCIELGGRSYAGPTGRVWMLDPVDGTKGFLRGGQYVVCATLLIDGAETVAAFGCPHVDVAAGAISEQDAQTDGTAGCLVSAIRGRGAFVRPLSTGALAERRRIEQRRPVDDLRRLRFCENAETTSPQFAGRAEIAAALGATTWAPMHVFSTQLRYLALALDLADVVLRAPRPGEAPPHIWDHAGGVMVFAEAGGKVTDLNGKDLVFTAGRDLTENFGLVACPAGIHAQVIEAVKGVFAAYPEYNGIVQS
ncbi:myo-inositol-1(or 4)-monophosphatase [Cordyceps militaris CM01]|uniref:Myo-inositol-1(Or 4)-monophosphatase n=1 Tax=Cordyceps militaris (strain CM01) TaxID=983644 RepID=G3J9R9_CORMM|nr:myo-inositol-1(or 4)-monophosphatase [Cordyceps militaris CM01]EGX94992.1 myo-inositol-1(or 4)-monophosphatase [Cordyceps militaris CM01]